MLSTFVFSGKDSYEGDMPPTLPPFSAPSGGNLVSGLFNRIVHCVVILEGMHSFRDDERYGEILRRLCN